MRLPLQPTLRRSRQHRRLERSDLGVAWRLGGLLSAASACSVRVTTWTSFLLIGTPEGGRSLHPLNQCRFEQHHRKSPPLCGRFFVQKLKTTALAVLNVLSQVVAEKLREFSLTLQLVMAKVIGLLRRHCNFTNRMVTRIRHIDNSIYVYRNTTGTKKPRSSTRSICRTWATRRTSKRGDYTSRSDFANRVIERICHIDISISVYRDTTGIIKPRSSTSGIR